MNQFKQFQKNNGATLAIVLIFLLLLTILGVSNMSDSILQQKASTNIYLESEAFHSAESGVSALLYADERGDSLIHGTLPNESGMGPTLCVDKFGELTEKKTDCVDMFNNVKTEANAEFLGCSGVCPEFEAGLHVGTVRCNGWKVSGTGIVAESIDVEVETWVSKVASCAAVSSDLDLE